MKTLPKMEIGDELEGQISEGIRVSDLCKADVIRQALRIGLPQFASRFQPAPLWLEERIREALTEPAELTSRKQIDQTNDDQGRGLTLFGTNHNLESDFAVFNRFAAQPTFTRRHSATGRTRKQT